MRITSLKHIVLYPIIMIIVLITAMFFASGCNDKDDNKSIQINYSLPTDNEVVRSLATSVNIPGSNQVITDGRHIYFTSSENNFSRADTDGQNLTVLNEQQASWPMIADEQIFYAAGSTSGPLSKMKLDGSSHVRAGSGSLSNLVFYQDMIYAIEEPDRSLIRIKTDGTKREKLLDFPVSSFVLRGSSLYAAGKSAQDGIIRYELDNSSQERLAESAAGNLQLDNGFLYYADLQKQYHLYALDLSGFDDLVDNDGGQGKETVTESSQDKDELKPSLIIEYSFDRQFAVYDQMIYFIDSGSQQQLFRSKLDNDNKTSIADAVLTADDAVDSFCLIGPYVYYRRAGINRLYRTDISNSRPIRIN